ncbi:MAG TPA: hypothetical protein VHL31_17240 [Geminicoccus sp.]|jgi:hypothetical protein|uniref:hypothetical protein n=1 Tax=Geminicoccus sp. TaxID=2024832 RepID=UPI002E35B2AD|nr:hypothetical protein [Geminicoccus sp.]HEX2528032.1 hypothetical protein [Geminicoccus sp.]
MMPQSTFLVLAEVIPEREQSLRDLLATMNVEPGMADPANALVPFERFEQLHVARFTFLQPPAEGDIEVYGLRPTPWPLTLAFLGDCDGPAETFLAELVREAGPGLCRIFSCCRGFAPDGDILAWLCAREQPSAATYVNWIGRTVVQIREEAALRKALVEYVDQSRRIEPVDAATLRNRILTFVAAERRAGRLTLTPPPTTPLDWRLRNAVHAVGVPVILLVLAPFLLVASPVLIFMLRSRETSDPELAPPPDPAHVRQLEDLEDHDVTNQFSAMGDIKPGRFRRWLVVFLLWLLDYASRHIFRRGYLTRVQTIHFARWVFLDDRRRLFFASNYDGSLESYMDDFINKVAWGINLVFGNGIGFPRVSWLIKGGARFEGKYKRYLRRHQIPTAVWYKAYPDLSVVDLNRNSQIRLGLERQMASEREVREWLSLL